MSAPRMSSSILLEQHLFSNNTCARTRHPQPCTDRGSEWKLATCESWGVAHCLCIHACAAHGGDMSVDPYLFAHCSAGCISVVHQRHPRAPHKKRVISLCLFVKQERQTKVCQVGVSLRCVKEVCQGGVSRRCVKEVCRRRCVTKVCQGGVSRRN